jgi:hypothetical protein
MIIAISVAAITLALSIGNPSIEKSKEILLLDQGKANLKVIDSAINQVQQEGSGSSREITLNVMGGNYYIGGKNVTFTMETNQQIISSGVARYEDSIYVEAFEGKIVAHIEYAFEFSGEKILEKGTHSLVISNQNGKIKIV